VEFKKETLLIIAPHADDEILGCYGLIKKVKDNGGKVFVQILTLGGYEKIEGEKITKEEWTEELIKVSQALGIDDYDIAYTNNEMQHIDSKPQDELIGHI
jgi:LmbE family N-acetylglucosaminyl deacetylase